VTQQRPRAVRPGRAVRLGVGEYQVAASARETGRASWAELRGWGGERAWQVRFVTPVCLRRGNRTSPWRRNRSRAAWPNAGSGSTRRPRRRRRDAVRRRCGSATSRGTARRGAHPVPAGPERRAVAAHRGGDLGVHWPHPLCLRSRHPDRGRGFRCAAGVRRLCRGRLALHLRVRSDLPGAHLAAADFEARPAMNLPDKIGSERSHATRRIETVEHQFFQERCAVVSNNVTPQGI
jgi:hypothetical protein